MSDWTNEPSVSDLRAPRVTDEQPVRHTRRRSTRHWCCGKIGVEHVGETKLNRYAESLQLYPLQDASRSPWHQRSWRNRSWRRNDKLALLLPTSTTTRQLRKNPETPATRPRMPRLRST